MLKTLTEITSDLRGRGNRPTNLRNRSTKSSALADIISLQTAVCQYQQQIFHVTDCLDHSLLQTRLLFIAQVMRKPQRTEPTSFVFESCFSFPKGLILQALKDRLTCVVSIGCVGFNILGAPLSCSTIILDDYITVTPLVILATHISL